jgi:Xaa-Pro dipeptidase
MRRSVRLGGMNLDAIQTALKEQKLDGWLFYDHHHRDPIAYRILGLSESLHVTRRWYYLIPAEGEPRKLVHRIEAGRLDTLPGSKAVYSSYSSWQELEANLKTMLEPFRKLAMQYSPRNAIMYVSMVDAGTVELLREFGKTIVSSSDLVSHFEAVLSAERIATHYQAQKVVDEVLMEGFREIGRRVRSAAGETTEFALVGWLSEALRRGGLVWENSPDVAVNENTSDSHYAATEAATKPIREGDFVLIDIWGRVNRPESIFYDITWTGVVGREPSARERMVFKTVRDARDAAISTVQAAFVAGRPIAGWEADDASRAVIREAGFGEFFTHRTGHNIATEIHGNGAHLDNLETHDERLLLPFTCFSVEPGIYLPEFGVRSEIDMITSAKEAVVTGMVQRELLRI